MKTAFFLKILGTLIASSVTFLGWNVEDIKPFLSKEFTPYVIPTESPSEKPKPSISPNEDKSQKEKPLPAKQKENPISTSIPVAPKIPTSPKKLVVEKKPALTPQDKFTFTPATQKPAPVTILPVEIPVMSKPEQSSENISTEEKIKRSVANLYCQKRQGLFIETVTGSAVAISGSGIYLTNAHVAEHLLLESYLPKGTISCFIRTGSPAKNFSKAKVLYLPTSWVNENKNNLKLSSPLGTGEKDYALIMIDSENLSSPSLISYLEIGDTSPKTNDDIFIAGYPAYNQLILENALYAQIQSSKINLSFGFNGNGSDAFDTAPTTLGVIGSSGGAIASKDGKLLGIIVATLDGYSNNKSIRGISINYIKNNIQNESGRSLSSFIQNASTLQKTFQENTVPGLGKTLTGN